MFTLFLHVPGFGPKRTRYTCFGRCPSLFFFLLFFAHSFHFWFDVFICFFALALLDLFPILLSVYLLCFFSLIHLYLFTLSCVLLPPFLQISVYRGSQHMHVVAWHCTSVYLVKGSCPCLSLATTGHVSLQNEDSAQALGVLNIRV